MLFSRVVFGMQILEVGVMLNGLLNDLLNELEQIKEIALPHWIGNVDVQRRLTTLMEPAEQIGFGR
ncbi:hypothetical protein DEU73_109291 [Paenibacillus taichungensis]|nr:hypothetical protein DEU73_109291 [Paenibacillus taichungensis]